MEFNGARPGSGGCYQTSDNLKLIAETQAGQRVGEFSKTIYGTYDITDGWQNLLRWANDLPAAKKVAEQWQAATGDKEALPALRLGEIEFLMHQYNDAAAEFGLAAHRSRLASYFDNDLAVDQAELDRGAALLAAGRTAEATQLLRPLDSLGTQGYSYQNSLPNGQGSINALLFATVFLLRVRAAR